MKEQERPKLTDEQIIEMQFGGYLRWLQDNGLPTPFKNELRMMFYSSLYVEFQNQVRKNQDQFLEQLRTRIPQVQQALQEQQERRAQIGAKESPVEPSPENVVSMETLKGEPNAQQ